MSYYTEEDRKYYRGMEWNDEHVASVNIYINDIRKGRVNHVGIADGMEQMLKAIEFLKVEIDYLKEK